MRCCVPGCGNYTGVRLFRIPRGPRPFQSHRRRLWLEAMNCSHWTEDKTRNALVCSAHFISGQVSLIYTDPDFVPSIFGNTKITRTPKMKKQRPTRKKKREETLVTTEQNLTSTDLSEPESSNQLLPDGADIEVELAEYDELKLRHGQLYNEHTNLQMAFASLWTEHQALKDTLRLPRVNYSSLKWDDQQLRFLTGLRSVVFDWLVAQISSNVSRIHLELTLQDHLLVVLMKLKLGLCDTDLAYRFQIPTSDVTYICQTWIPAMAIVLRPLISWPSAEAVLKNRPRIFEREFERCRCIVDCAKFVVASETSPDDWSNNSGVKYLIGVTPHGAVSFLSAGFDEYFSDRRMARESGFLRVLEPLDEILANRTFLIRDIVDRISATLHTPDLINGKKMKNSDFVREFGHVWSHVKRVIGWWREFVLLEKVIPALYANLLDDVMTVCAAITNVNMSLVPQVRDHL